MSYDALHDKILDEGTEPNICPAVICDFLDDYQGGGTLIFKVNSLISPAVLSSSRLMDGKVYARDGVCDSELAEELMNSLITVPGVDRVTLGAPSAFSLQVSKKPGYSLEDIEWDVLVYMCLLLDGWMEHTVRLIRPVKNPLGSALPEKVYVERDINPIDFLLS